MDNFKKVSNVNLLKGFDFQQQKEDLANRLMGKRKDSSQTKGLFKKYLGYNKRNDSKNTSQRPNTKKTNRINSTFTKSARKVNYTASIKKGSELDKLSRKAKINGLLKKDMLKQTPLQHKQSKFNVSVLKSQKFSVFKDSSDISKVFNDQISRDFSILSASRRIRFESPFKKPLTGYRNSSKARLRTPNKQLTSVSRFTPISKRNQLSSNKRMMEVNLFNKQKGRII